MTKQAATESEAAAILRDVQHAVIAYQDAAKHETNVGEKLVRASELVKKRRLELGKALVRARALWPQRGPKAKPWGDMLKHVGLDQDVALDAMRYAGYVEETYPGTEPGNLPTLREAGIDKRPTVDQRPKLELVPSPPPDSEIEEALAALPPMPLKADRDSYCTPKIVTSRLPVVDLDPCSNPRSTVKAKTAYSLETNQNGLALPWFGLIFANVPFSNPEAWVNKYIAETQRKQGRRVEGLGWLCNVDHSTKWWQRLVVDCELFYRLDFDKRLQFDAGIGVETTSNDRPQSLLMTASFFKRCPESLFDLGIVWRVQ